MLLLLTHVDGVDLALDHECCGLTAESVDGLIYCAVFERADYVFLGGESPQLSICCLPRQI